MSRERVNSPGELRPGDRVEVGEDPNLVVVLDLLFFGQGVWQGLIVAHPPGMIDAALVPMVVGNHGYILATAYALRRVFIRRRSREDVTRVARAPLKMFDPELERISARLRELVVKHRAEEPR